MITATTKAVLDADESAMVLANFLVQQRPYFYVRYGDGAIECVWDREKKRGTCDGEIYTHDLAAALLRAWVALEKSPYTVFAGDWQSASFGGKTGTNRESERWAKLTENSPFTWVHFEALLLMRKSQALVDFYRAVQSDPRPKVYLGPHEGAARWLGARHVRTPMIADLHRHSARIVEQLEAQPFEVCLFGAGMAGQVAAIESWGNGPERTYISLGSAMDPLFGRKTRTQQLSRAALEIMFQGML